MCVCEIQYSVSVCVHACDDDDDVCVVSIDKSPPSGQKQT